jgi:hypothetical protein
MAMLVAACAPAASTSATPGPTGASSAPAGSPSPSSTAAEASSERYLDGQPMPACVRSAVPARCARIMVPEDPADPTGRQIGLWVMVIPARTVTPAPDPVFLLAGGPGGAATTSFDWAPGTFRELHETRDMVTVDQRGTGSSNQMVVPPGPDLTGLDAAARTNVRRARARARAARTFRASGSPAGRRR